MKMSVVHETPMEAEATEVLSPKGPVLAVDPEDIENNTEKSIDFNSQLLALKARTETELPHTLS